MNFIFFGLNASVFETLKDDYNDKYEYIAPEITLDKNLLSSEILGNLDLQTNVVYTIMIQINLLIF